MDDFAVPDKAEQLNTGTDTSKVADEEIAPIDEEPSSEPHDIDEQIERFGLKEKDQEDIKPLGDETDISKE